MNRSRLSPILARCGAAALACWWLGSVVVSAQAIPKKPEEADDAALKAIDEMRVLEPQLPRPDNIPMAVGPGSMTLSRAVEIAVANNTTMQTRRESVRHIAMNYVATRRGYGPQWRATMSASRREVASSFNEFRTAQQYTESHQLIGVTQKLPFGGAISADVGGAFTQYESRPGDYAPSASISLTQPLLRGAGYDLYKEPLEDARLRLLDALRSYKLQLEDFTISIVSDYLTLQNIEQKIANTRQRAEAFDHLVKRSQAFFELGLESEIEVLRATQEALQSRQELIDLEYDLANRREVFAITLNLPPDAKIELVHFNYPNGGDQVSYEFDREKTVAEALAARPDLQSAADSVEQSRRKLKLAKRNLLPDLGLNLSANARNASLRSNDTQIREEYVAGITLSLPLERTRERLQLYGAWQTVQQDERALTIARSNIVAAVHRRIRQIESIEKALELQGLVVANAQKTARIAAFRFERGEASNRSLIDAQLIESRAVNRNLDLQLSRYLAFLYLKRDTGRLQIRPRFVP